MEVFIIELLYVWINRTRNGIFRKQDICINDEYNIRFDIKSHKLEVIQNVNYYNLFKNDVIDNVSALVGENGAGKTTLLKYIFENDIMPKNKEKRKEYTDSSKINYEESKTIQIYKNNEQIIAIHNLEENITSEYKSIYIIQVNNDSYNKMFEKQLYLNEVTKIYLSNGIYNSDLRGWTSEGRVVSKIALIPQSMSLFGNHFYRKTVSFPETIIKDNLYNGLQDIIISEKTDIDFQAICDVLYFNYLNSKKGQFKSFAGKISTNLLLSSDLLINVLYRKKDKKPKTYISSINYYNLIENKIKIWDNFIKSNKCNIHDLNVRMKLNLIFEIDFIYNIIKQDYIDNPIGENALFDNCIDLVKTKFYEEDNEIIYYYSNAANEIRKLENIILGCEFRNNSLPTNDMAYEKWIEVDLDKNREAYKNFIELINQVATAPFSFILKYLNIENLKFSSGERAYLNLFSRLNLIPFFNKINSNVINSTKKNILLLIDEIELYCHPDWQRKFIKYLLNELNIQFPEKKIQIIFATHSPIVLSDVPVANTVYIRKKNNGSIIDNRNRHKETFAANIYQLFNDAFFLSGKGEIGEYAKSKINFVIKKLKNPKQFDYEDSDVLNIIETIGEPVIKRKIFSMYKKRLSNCNENHQAIPNEKESPSINIEREKLISLKIRLEKMINEINESLD